MRKIKNKLTNIKNHQQYNRILYWAKNISITGIAQIVIQVVGFLSAILIIRLLPVEDYAFYTIANTMLGAMTILSDGGISTGVMAEGGKVWKDPIKLGKVAATGLAMRRRFAIISLIITFPILVSLLLKNGCSWLTAVLIFLSLIPAFYAALSDSIYKTAPSLHQVIKPIQKNQVSVGVLRLLMTGITVFIFPFAYIAILASGIPRMYGNVELKKIGLEFIDYDQEPDPKIKKDILLVVKKILPESIYFILSSQITIWLISIFGNTTNVAQIGVLGRFAVVFTMLGYIINSLFTPRFARSEVKKKRLIHIFIQLQGILFSLSFITIAGFYIFDNQLLWILGDAYKGLKTELLLIAISGGIGFISSSTNILLASRSIIVPPAIYITIAIITQIITAIFLPLHQVSGVIQFSIFTVLVLYLVRIFYLFYYIRRYDVL